MQATNLSSPDLNVNNESSTEVFFNNFFTKNINISPNADSAIVAYFLTIADNVEAAQALAASVIYTSLSQDVDPMLTLDQFRKMDSGELNLYLALFLNLNRVGSSLLGVSNRVTTNKYVSRTIIP
jgi:hypothetical protein